MKKILFLLLVTSFSFTLFSQQFADLQENAPYSYNGLEYGFYISNEKAKEVKGDDFDRYEISLYVTNKSGCVKIIPFKTLSLPSTESDNEVMIAEFSCKNATGKRLTAKGGKVNAKPWYAQVKVPDETQSSKFKYINAQIGYAVK